jgi:hypothetical protein
LINKNKNKTIFIAFHRNVHTRKAGSHLRSMSIKCEQSANESQGASVWLGRLAMLGFATAMTIEVSTGKGLLEVEHLLILLR